MTTSPRSQPVMIEPSSPAIAQRRASKRNSSYNFLQTLRTNAMNPLPTIPSPTSTKLTDSVSIAPRTPRFSMAFDDIRKSIASFSIRSFESDASTATADQEYRTSGRSPRWSTASGSTSVITGATLVSADRNRNRKVGYMSVARQDWENSKRKWISDRYQQECYITQCKQDRDARRLHNLRSIPNYQSLVDTATSNFQVQNMFLRPLAVQANEKLVKSEDPSTTSEVMEQQEETLKRLSRDVCEAVMGLY